MTNKRFCYRDPEFPNEGYLALLFMSATDDDKLRFLYPMMPLYPSLAMLRTKIRHFKDKLEKRKKLTVYGVIAVKINLVKKFPLRKEHWANPQGELFEKDYRLTKFREMMADMPQLYSVIVLPNDYDIKTKKWSLINWIPILMTTSDEKIDNLIKASDQSVDESASSMGIYSIEFTKGFDLDTGKLIEPKSDNIKGEADC
ncbi:MAG: hypothetical protein HQK53_18985 [Oligoflexia bacterium]|nr:hypothetical protein [Oligoflexia bacterium]